MDGHRLTTSTDKTGLVFDFDGINAQKLQPIITTTNLMFDRDYKNSYTLAPSIKTKDAFSITLTKLQVQ